MARIFLEMHLSMDGLDPVGGHSVSEKQRPQRRGSVVGNAAPRRARRIDLPAEHRPLAPRTYRNATLTAAANAQPTWVACAMFPGSPSSTPGPCLAKKRKKNTSGNGRGDGPALDHGALQLACS